MAYKRIKDVVDASIMDGSDRTYSFRKAPSVTTNANYWFDLSSSPGNPIPKYWFDATPLTAVQVKQSTDGGIFHGANVSPKQKVLRQLLAVANIVTPLPMPMILCDYLLYYPTIDGSNTDEQILTNNVGLPRHTSGEGVRIMAVSVANGNGGQTFTVNYTNSQGVSGRTATSNQAGQQVIGTVINSNNITASQSNAFMVLQEGDTGVRSIESVTMNGADIGLFTLLLVKPLAQFTLLSITAPVEVDYVKDFVVLPEIADDAYLNFICLPQGTLTNGFAIIGTITTTFH